MKSAAEKILYKEKIADEGFIAYEIGYDQADALRALCAEAIPDGSVSVLRDLGGNNRVVRVSIPPR